MLRLITSSILAFSFLLSATELHQLLRIPFLVSHYHQHRRDNASLNFWEFLQLHYTNDHPDDQDEQEDDGLPFKSSANINHLDQSLSHPTLTLTRPDPASLTQFVICYSEGHPCSQVYGIFHPPRL